MRRGMEPKAIANENGKIVGFNLSADFVAEHECGIKQLQSSLGIPMGNRNINNKEKPVMGVAARTITKSESIQHRKFEYGKKHYIILTNDVYALKDDSPSLPREVTPYEGKEIWAAWDEGTFALVVEAKEEEHIINLKKEMDNQNVMLTFQSGGPFGNSGLCFLIVSEMDEEFKKKYFDADNSKYKLDKVVEKMGIKKKLTDAGCNFMALSPRWKNEETGEIQFWLNPYNQHANNYGWYTEEDLLKWIDGKGPIPKKQ